MICPVQTCEKELSQLHHNHFVHAHDMTPYEFVVERYSDDIERYYCLEGYNLETTMEKLPEILGNRLVRKYLQKNDLMAPKGPSEHPEDCGCMGCSPKSDKNKEARERGFEKIEAERKEVTCKNCGHVQIRKQSVIEHNLNGRTEIKFCKECQSEWLSENMSGEDSPSWKGGDEEVTCKNCGSVRMYKRNIARRLDYETEFCKFCKSEYLSNVRVGEKHPSWEGGDDFTDCDYCGEETVVNVTTQRDFCDHECYAKYLKETNLFTGPNNGYWKGGYDPYYGPNWREQRRKARDRDNYECQNCGITEEELGQEMDVHHITPFREFDDYEEANKLENLICYCQDCHRVKEDE